MGGRPHRLSRPFRLRPYRLSRPRLPLQPPPARPSNSPNPGLPAGRGCQNESLLYLPVRPPGAGAGLLLRPYPNSVVLAYPNPNQQTSPANPRPSTPPNYAASLLWPTRRNWPMHRSGGSWYRWSVFVTSVRGSCVRQSNGSPKSPATSRIAWRPSPTRTDVGRRCGRSYNGWWIRLERWRSCGRHRVN